MTPQWTTESGSLYVADACGQSARQRIERESCEITIWRLSRSNNTANITIRGPENVATQWIEALELNPRGPPAADANRKAGLPLSANSLCTSAESKADAGCGVRLARSPAAPRGELPTGHPREDYWPGVQPGSRPTARHGSTRMTAPLTKSSMRPTSLVMPSEISYVKLVSGSPVAPVGGV